MNTLPAQAMHEDICLAVHGLLELPAISPMSTKLLGVIGDDSVSIHQLADIIRQDASLDARIIGLANSAYFGQREPIISVEDAIFKALGLRLTQNLALSIALSGPFGSHTQCAAFDVRGFWLKAVLTANLMQSFCMLLPEEHRINRDTAYLAGLLYEFGLLPLIYLFPEQMNMFFASSKTRHEDLCETLRKELDTDQHEVGAWLATSWRLPPAIIDVIAHHATPDYDGEHVLLVLLVRFCSRWAIQYIESGDWDRLPEGAEPLIEYTGLDQAQILDVLKQQHAKSEALESMSNALAES